MDEYNVHGFGCLSLCALLTAIVLASLTHLTGLAIVMALAGIAFAIIGTYD